MVDDEDDNNTNHLLDGAKVENEENFHGSLVSVEGEVSALKPRNEKITGEALNTV